MKTISRNSFRGPHCNEVSGNCKAISPAKQCFAGEKRNLRFFLRYVHYNTGQKNKQIFTYTKNMYMV
jgi:hypothetical protein